jgi:hypothetical protein
VDDARRALPDHLCWICQRRAHHFAPLSQFARLSY